MAETKFNAGQVNRPAPLWYRRFSNAMVALVIPAASAFIESWGMSDLTENRVLHGLIFLAAIIKGIGVFLGNGQNYTDKIAAGIVIVMLFTSCGTLHKSQTTTSTNQVMLDTSSSRRDYLRETVTTERGTVPVLTRPDTAGLAGFMPAGDTTGFHQVVETGGQKVRTDVKPRRDPAGKVTGYDVTTQAITKTQEVRAPVNKTTRTRETGTQQRQAGVTTSSTSSNRTSEKRRFSFNGWGAAAVIGSVAVLVIAIIYLIRKRNDKGSIL